MSAHEEITRTAYVEWFGLPQSERLPKTSKEWAVEFDVPERTLTSWRKATWFRERLAYLYDQINVSPDRLQQVMDAMHTAAVTGNTKAAELYLRAAEVIAPKQVLVKAQSVDELSDRELQAALKAAASELDRRESADAV